MDELRNEQPTNDEIGLAVYIAAFRKVWWKAVPISLGIGIITLLVMLRMPNVYKASAVITPASDEGKQSPALGAFTSIGIVVGGPTKIEDLETLFKSDDLTARVFRKYDLWFIVLGDRFDPKTGKMKQSVFGSFLPGSNDPKAPSDWDAIRVGKNNLKISANRKSGTLTISFESPSAEGSANIVKYYLEEGKSRLQEEAFDRAVKNKKFIEEQISRTIDPLTRERLYSLYGQEVEREMLAKNREQFGFKLIDSVRVPDHKIRPQRANALFLATFASWIFMIIIFVWLEGRKAGIE